MRLRSIQSNPHGRYYLGRATPTSPEEWSRHMRWLRCRVMVRGRVIHCGHPAIARWVVRLMNWW